MRILSTIASYNGKSNPYLQKVIDELSKVSEVIIFSTEEVEGYKTFVFDKSVGETLVFKNRKYIVDNIENYDYFLYNEDDIFISNESLKTLIDLNEKISSINLINNVGFLRYELDGDVKEFNDLHPAHSVHAGGNGQTDIIKEIQVIDNEVCLKPWNHHSGNFILSQKQLKYLIDNDLFSTEPNTKYVGLLESGASDVSCHLNKVVPYNYIEKLSTHHMSNKYVYNNRKVHIEEIDGIVKQWKS